MSARAMTSRRFMPPESCITHVIDSFSESSMKAEEIEGTRSAMMRQLGSLK